MATRGDRRAKRARHINIADEQIAALELLSDQSLGRPSLSALVRDALDRLIDHHVTINPVFASALERQRARPENVVPIRALKADEKP